MVTTDALMSDKDGDPADYTAELMPAANAPTVPHAPHETTSFGHGSNFGMVAPHEKIRKDTSGMTGVHPDADEDNVPVANDGVVSYVEATQETAARTYNAYTTTVLPGPGSYPGDPVLLVGDDPQRQKVTITNGSTSDAILLGPLNQIAAGAGFLLPAGQKHEPEVQSGIYACTLATGTLAVAIGVWVERNA